MLFYTGEKQYSQLVSQDSGFYLTQDSSLLYRGMKGDYSVLLGGNWRYELIVDSLTGLCTYLQSFLMELRARESNIVLPVFRQKDLYFSGNEMLEPGSGCHYRPFSNNAFWDRKNRILCLGDMDSAGEAIEFTPKTIAVVDDRTLKSVYLILDNIDSEMIQKYLMLSKR